MYSTGLSPRKKEEEKNITDKQGMEYYDLSHMLSKTTVLRKNNNISKVLHVSLYTSTEIALVLFNLFAALTFFELVIILNCSQKMC